MRRYLVTGGAGFIGSHLVRALLSQDKFVRVLDNFSTGRMENLADLLGSPQAERLEIIKGDIRDPEKVAEAVRGIEVVFHEAAFVSVAESMEKPQECFNTNITGTTALFEAARSAGVCRIVIASSAAVYGDSSDLPLAENTRTRPLSPYALSKQVGEMLGALYTRSFGLEVAALRYFNVYGPRQRPDSAYAAAIPIFMKCLRDKRPPTVFGDGSQTRDFVFVDDVVRANLIAADHPSAPGLVMNVCSGSGTSLLDLLRLMSGLFPDSPSYQRGEQRAGDILNSVGSPFYADQQTGFRIQTSLNDGLRQTADWIKASS